MKSHQIMTPDFLTIDARWSTERARELLERFHVRWVVVRRREASATSPLHHVFPYDEVLTQLEESSAPDILGALSLDRRAASPAVDAWHPAEAGPEARLVVDEGRVLGVVPPVGPPSMLHDAPVGFRSAVFGGPSDGAAPSLVTRHLRAHLPPHAAVGDRMSLTVWLVDRARGGESRPLSAPPGTKVDVLVRDIEGFSLVGPSEGTLTVTEPQSETAVRFKLRAEQEGTGSIEVLAYIGGEHVATFKMTSLIDRRADAPPDTTTREEDVMEDVAVTVSPHAHPDLSLLVLETGPTLTFHLWSADGQFRGGPIGCTRLEVSPRQHFEQFFRGIESLPLDTSDGREVAGLKIAARGSDLFEKLFPENLRGLLWDLRPRIRTVQIQSDQPWIPWEMCRLVRRSASGDDEEGPFLCEAFSVTRWLTNTKADVTRLTLDNIALVVPGGSGLQLAEMEKQDVLSLGGDERRVTVIEPRFGKLIRAMSQGIYDAWHFTGHAKADSTGDADRSTIELDEGEVVAPEDVSGVVARKVVKPRPFVFLNACQSGRGGLSLTGIGGWAARFLRAGPPGDAGLYTGASAFIGTLWAVNDDVAMVFARTLYSLLLSGKPIGDAVKQARAEARAHCPGDPTWLAYTVYADPGATVA